MSFQELQSWTCFSNRKQFRCCLPEFEIIVEISRIKAESTRIRKERNLQSILLLHVSDKLANKNA